MSKPTDQDSTGRKPWRDRWYEVIFEADTPAGKLFDVVLLVVIFVSVLLVILESVDEIDEHYSNWLNSGEWIITILFTLEYAARIACARRPVRYITSFYGVVDFVAIMPTYLMEILPGTQSLAVVRALRLLRAFRVFKLAHMLTEASALQRAIWESRAKISVFLAVVVIAVVIVGAAMYVIEGPVDGERGNPGFSSIPESMYWAVVTMTTVGYGDTRPETALGKTIAACMMILGYSLIIVPTGIVSAEMAQKGRKPPTTQVCPECMAEGHDHDAAHCKYCGSGL